MNTTYLFHFALIAGSAVLNAFASFSIKSCFEKLGPLPLSLGKELGIYGMRMLRMPLFMAGFASFLLAPLFWFYSLGKMSLSVAYPLLLTLQLATVFVLGIGVLKELFTWQKLSGLFFLILSLFLFHWGESG